VTIYHVFASRACSRILFLFFVVCIGLLFALSSYAADSPGEINLQGQIPHVDFRSVRADLGTVYRGDVVSADFSFENDGRGTLSLSSIHASCGCINTQILDGTGTKEKNVFKPGEEGRIRTFFNSSSFLGAIVRTITVETNAGGSSPTITLTLSAQVVGEISSQPDLLYIGRSLKGQEKTFYVKLNLGDRAHSAPQNKSLTNILSAIDRSSIASSLKSTLMDSRAPLAAVAVETEVPYLTARLLPQTDPHHQTIEVKLDGRNIPTGALTTKLIVWNNSNYYKNMEIPVVGEILSHVQSSDKYVEFGVVSVSQSAERVVKYTSDNPNFTITSVKIDLKRLPEMKGMAETDLFDVRKVPLDGNSSGEGYARGIALYFKLRYPKKGLAFWQSKSINVSGSFVVKTNDPDDKEITVPFFGILRKAP
jgi:hypothetical protein